MTVVEALRSARRTTGRSISIFVRDIGHGLLEIGHNSLAVIGLAAVAIA
jgi:hypothetical protein